MEAHDFGTYTCVAKGNEHQAQAQVELKRKSNLTQTEFHALIDQPLKTHKVFVDQGRSQ